MRRMNYITMRPFSTNGSRTREPPKNKHATGRDVASTKPADPALQALSHQAIQYANDEGGRGQLVS
ncbi:hypothetical protein BD779DRAFT_1518901 [Infundibulicybe gibba]|nr:hypothetical protein BD779DRAFT_1518901 [Infundibulicybe gibba]